MPKLFFFPKTFFFILKQLKNLFFVKKEKYNYRRALFYCILSCNILPYGCHYGFPCWLQLVPLKGYRFTWMEKLKDKLKNIRRHYLFAILCSMKYVNFSPNWFWWVKHQSIYLRFIVTATGAFFWLFLDYFACARITINQEYHNSLILTLTLKDVPQGKSNIFNKNNNIFLS